MEDIQENKKTTQPPGGWTKHAPAGGISINGKFFSGGTFIPNDDMESASQGEKDELEKRQELIKKYGPEKVKDMLKSGKSLSPTSSAEMQSQKEPVITENVYIIDDGALLGGNKYGDLIIKKGALREEDISILNSLKTNRIDCVLDGKQVITYVSKNGEWPSKEEPTKSDIKEYSLLNNLSEAIKKYLTTAPPMFRMSLLSNNTWRVEHNKENKILRLCNCEEKGEILKVKSLSDKLGVPTQPMAECEGGLLSPDIPPLANNKNLKLTFVINLILGDIDPASFGKDGTKLNYKLPTSSDIQDVDRARLFTPHADIYGDLTLDDLIKQFRNIKLPEESPNIIKDRFYNIGKHLTNSKTTEVANRFKKYE